MNIFDLKDNFCSFDLSYKLRAKNINFNTDTYFYHGMLDVLPQKSVVTKDFVNSHTLGAAITPRPTHSMLLAWLRIKYKLWVDVGYEPKDNSSEEPQEVTWWSFISQIGVLSTDKPLFENFGSPEEAYEAAFNYILDNLI